MCVSQCRALVPKFLPALTYLTQCKETPELDQAVEVAEADVDGYKQDVCWVPEEVTPKLDCLAKEKRPAQ